MRCENVANGLQQRGGRMRMRCLQIADTWRTNCNNVANIPQMRGEQIATMLRTFGEYVANNLQQCCEHSTNAWRTNCNNATFKKQKPYFCNSKTPFLHDKNHTFAPQKPYFCNANM
ncbi:hypothetical protein [Prevotella pallens]|uniref:hypothetical protein n=1 Tax=Prevotella pallens TaxID=60133 RepID=UPI003C7CF44F